MSREANSNGFRLGTSSLRLQGLGPLLESWGWGTPLKETCENSQIPTLNVPHADTGDMQTTTVAETSAEIMTSGSADILDQPMHVNSEDLRQQNMVFFRLSMLKLDTHILPFLRHRHNLKGKIVILEFFGTPIWHNTVPKANLELLRLLEEVDNGDGLGPRHIPELYEDLELGIPEVLVAVVLLILVRYADKLHLHFSAGCFLHNFPIFSDLFHEPKVSPTTGFKTWSRPPCWKKPYWSVLLETVAPKLQTLEANMTWSMASTVAHPPFNTMIPISRLPNLSNLQKLVVPYFAVIPRPRSGISVFPTSALPSSLVELVVVEAYPSRPLCAWLRGIQADRNRLQRLEFIEVRFEDSFARRSFDAFFRDVSVIGCVLIYRPPALVIPLLEKGYARACCCV
jgi:hypothetical protein